MEFLYSVNDTDFYYRNNKGKKVCMNKNEHINYQYEQEELKARKRDSISEVELVRMILERNRIQMKKYFKQ